MTKRAKIVWAVAAAVFLLTAFAAVAAVAAYYAVGFYRGRHLFDEGCAAMAGQEYDTSALRFGAWFGQKMVRGQSGACLTRTQMISTERWLILNQPSDSGQITARPMWNAVTFTNANMSWRRRWLILPKRFGSIPNTNLAIVREHSPSPTTNTG